MTSKPQYIFIIKIQGKEKTYFWIKKTTKSIEDTSGDKHCRLLMKYLNEMGRSAHKKDNLRVEEYLHEFPVTSLESLIVDQYLEYKNDVDALTGALKLFKEIDSVEGQLCLTTVFR